MKLTLSVLGRSGSGKGTQAGFLIERLGGPRHVAHMETGRFLRTFLKTHSNETARRAKKEMAEGNILPSWLATYTWLQEFIDGGAGSKHLVFDGAPRTVWQAELLDEIMAWHERPLPLCVYIDISKKEGMTRLLARGRSDDECAAIRNRMKFFDKEVAPTIAYFKKKKRLIHIDGEQSIEEVWKEIDGALEKRLKEAWKQQ